MKIVILGANDLSIGIASYLHNNGEEVTVVDESLSTVTKLREEYTFDIVVGDALDRQTLRNANVHQANAVIVNLGSDEKNIVTCKIIDILFNIPLKIAFNNDRYNTFNQEIIKEQFGIDVLLNDKLEITNLLTDIININGALEVIDFHEVTILKLRCKIGSEILHTSFKHIQEVTDLHLFILTITRNGNTFFPSSSDIMLPGDDVYLVTSKAQIEDVMSLFGYENNRKSSIICYGQPKLIQQITSRIDKYDITMCNSDLHDTTNEHDGVNVISAEEFYDYITESETNIAVIASNNDSVNVVQSQLITQQHANTRILTLTQDSKLHQLLHKYDNICCISINDILNIVITKHLYSNHCFAITPTQNPLINVIKVPVTQQCKHIGNNIASIKIRNHIMPMFILRNNELLFARDKYILELHDELFISIAQDSLQTVKQIFPC